MGHAMWEAQRWVVRVAADFSGMDMTAYVVGEVLLGSLEGLSVFGL